MLDSVSILFDLAFASNSISSLSALVEASALISDVEAIPPVSADEFLLILRVALRTAS